MAKGKIQEKIIEAIIYTCGTVSTLAILLIVFFLFKEGGGLFLKTPLEEGYVIALHPDNPVKSLQTQEIKKIFNQEIKNWKNLGHPQALPIEIFTPSVAEQTFDSKALGEDFQHLKKLLTDYFTQRPNLIVAMPQRYVASQFHIIHIPNTTLIDFLGGRDWYPTSQPLHSFGILAIVLGTLWVCLGALCIAIPVGVITAIYLAEVASPLVRNLLIPLIELLAGIPSVIYGFFGLVVLVPWIQESFSLSVGETALAGSIILGIIALPTIITLAIDALGSVPQALRESSFALGANHWQTIWRVILPYSISGIVSAAILGVGRTVGETMAVLMVTGNAAQMPYSFLIPVRTITATVAAELGEAPQGGLHYEALFLLACLLFIITFFLNLVAEWVVASNERK